MNLKEEFYFELFKNRFKSIHNGSFILVKNGGDFILESPIKLSERYTAMKYHFVSNASQNGASGYIYMNDIETFSDTLKRIMENFLVFIQKENELLEQEPIKNVYQLNEVC